MKQLLVALAAVLGIVLVIIAAIYFLQPASALPGFFPGHDPSLAKHHVKHGVAALLLALGCFAYAWFQSGKRSAEQKQQG